MNLYFYITEMEKRFFFVLIKNIEKILPIDTSIKPFIQPALAGIRKVDAPLN